MVDLDEIDELAAGAQAAPTPKDYLDLNKRIMMRRLAAMQPATDGGGGDKPGEYEDHPGQDTL